MQLTYARGASRTRALPTGGFAISIRLLSLRMAYAAEPALPSAPDVEPAASAVEVRGSAPTASASAPSQSSLDARSAQSEVTDEFVCSPGSAPMIGQATFNGGINLLSRRLEPNRRTTASASYCTRQTQTCNLEHESGQFGERQHQNLLFTMQDVRSNGFQTFNQQKRGAVPVRPTATIVRA